MAKNPINNSLLSKDHFWKITKALMEVKEFCNLERFLASNEVSESEFEEVVQFLKLVDFPFSIEMRDGEKFLIPVRDWSSVHINMNLVEWLAMQTQFPNFFTAKEQSSKPFEIIQDKLCDVEEYYPDLSVFSALEKYVEKETIMFDISEEYEHIVPIVNQSIQSNSVIDIHLKNKKIVEAYIHQVVFLEGVLSLIGEDCNDRCLISLEVDEIEEVSMNDRNYSVNFSHVEIGDFISALRVVTGEEIRLVLKVHKEESLELNPEYHFLGNPYVTNNLDGDMIWAASVEASNELFEWLYQIKDGIEILDPSNIKSEFQEYCINRQSEDSVTYKKAA